LQLLLEGAVGPDHLDAMVQRVGDEHAVAGIDVERMWQIELARAAARLIAGRRPDLQHVAAGIELKHAVVEAADIAVADPPPALGVEGDVGDLVELYRIEPGALTARAAGADAAEKLAAFGKLLDAVSLRDHLSRRHHHVRDPVAVFAAWQLLNAQRVRVPQLIRKPLSGQGPRWTPDRNVEAAALEQIDVARRPDREPAHLLKIEGRARRRKLRVQLILRLRVGGCTMRDCGDKNQPQPHLTATRHGFFRFWYAGQFGAEVAMRKLLAQTLRKTISN